jgi:hypothetical protein
MKTIATINFKGGVGKTTVTWAMAQVIAQDPKRYPYGQREPLRCRSYKVLNLCLSSQAVPLRLWNVVFAGYVGNRAVARNRLDGDKLF